ncbi:dynein regulatory complex protein 9-like [Hyposmocoma kahamanoa]|uniref:dynein regulatory complex protein 9-like n=1 Tax=Hyposmocoma kahamanoa TaxID=1477025 RepID=UPI000E6D723F|nr:dynein regulatory complex protein 9-like [Hyposmocoma kahamanoa]
MFATVLEDAIMKIKVLIDANNESALDKFLVDMDMHIRKRYGVAEPLVKDELEYCKGNRSLESDEFKLRKMDDDRTFFTEVMRDTYIDIALHLHYNTLTATNSEITERKKAYLAIKEAVSKNDIRCKEMQKQIRLLCKKNKCILYDANAFLDKLQKNVEDAEVTQETQGRYLEKWENARKEQHRVVLGKIETESTKNIRYYRDQMEQEQVVHSEIETLVNLAINDTIDQVQTWMEKYDVDIEEMDLKIQVKKNEYELEREKRMNIEEKLKRNEKELNDWNEFKLQREIAQKYASDMNRCAIIVQSWWRGLLVRHQLGPYRPPKKRRGNKKA